MLVWYSTDNRARRLVNSRVWEILDWIDKLRRNRGCCKAAHSASPDHLDGLRSTSRPLLFHLQG